MSKYVAPLAILGLVFNASAVLAQNNQSFNTSEIIGQPCEPEKIYITKEVEVEVIRPVVIPLSSNRAQGDAVASDVLEGRTFSNSDAVDIPGTMENKGAMTFIPATTDQNVPEGYHNGSGTVTGDPNLLSGNIKNGVSIFGITGTSIQASGTATPDQVLAGQTYSNASGPATGTITNIGQQNITPSTADQGITRGYHDGTGIVAGDADLVSGNVRAGANIFGVPGDTNVVNTSSGDAVAGDMLNGKKAWVDGSEVTGTMPTQTLSDTSTALSAGYYEATNLSSIDEDLKSSNFCAGVEIFGITGTGASCALDCNGVPGGGAFQDNCATCVGGDTGKDACVPDCNGDWGGTAYLDNCYTCVGGNTGRGECKTVFVSSTTHTGVLGGLDGADNECKTLAGNAGLKGTYKAWLSDSLPENEPIQRFTTSTGPYIRTDGARIADSWADLIDGDIQNPINKDESKTEIADNAVWTNTTSSGSRDNNALIYTCNDWTHTSLQAKAGLSNGMDSNWTNSTMQPCDESLHLYCIEQ